MVETNPFDFEELDGAKRDKERLQIELESYEGKIRSLERSLDEKQKQKRKVDDSLVQAKKRISELETDNKNLETTRDNARHEAEIANQEFIEQRTDNERLKQEKESLLLEVCFFVCLIVCHKNFLYHIDRNK